MPMAAGAAGAAAAGWTGWAGAATAVDVDKLRVLKKKKCFK